MTIDRPSGGDKRAAAGASGEIVRLIVVSAVAVILLAGGVYWLRQLPANPGALESGATVQVQVQLLRTVDPIPVQVPAPDRQVMADRGNGGQSPEPEPSWSDEDDQVPPVPPAPAQLDSPAKTNVALPPSISRNSPSEAALKFRQMLLQHIARYQRYPSSARAKGMEGRVQVLFRLRRDGRVLDAQVMRSSGEVVLDTEAVATLYRAEPLPSIPSEMPDELKVLLPIDFSLQ
jgi:periplasmic protein TonB